MRKRKENEHETNDTCVGDSEEPVYVIAEHAVINGKPTENFAGYVRKGETLRIMIDHRFPARNGSVRVLLKEPDATPETTGERGVERHNRLTHYEK